MIMPGWYFMAMWFFFGLLIIMGLAGCATQQPTIVRVSGDTYCRQVTENGKFALDWVPEDTPETITKIEKQGERWRQVCGKVTARAR